jgi:hypothetical protein
MMILPWKTDKDQWQWVNLEYYFPFGNMLAIFRDAKALDSGEALRDLGISNPFSIHVSTPGFRPARILRPCMRIPAFRFTMSSIRDG